MIYLNPDFEILKIGIFFYFFIRLNTIIMKKNLLSLTVIILLLVIVSSCSDDKFSGYKTANNGTYYKVHVRGNDTSKATESEIVTVNLAYRIEDSTIFNSTTLGEPMKFPLVKSMFKGDLYDGIKLMGIGDSITVAVIADSFYLKSANLTELPKFVVSGSYLYYDIKLLNHISNAEFQIELANKRLEDERQEKIQLQNYLNSNNIGKNPTSSGLYFISIKEGRGNTPDTGSMCQVYLSVSQLDGEELFSNFGGRALDIEFGGEFDTKGFMEGLGMLKPGGVAQFIVPSWIGVGSTGRDMVAPYTTLIYDVKLEAIRTLAEVKKDREQYQKEKEIEKLQLQKDEPKKISSYLKENNITIQPLESGLYIKELISGSGDYPTDGNTVTVEYIHYDLEGNILQSSYSDKTPFTYVVGTGAVIPGWEEAVKQMKKGGKTWMLIPSKIGWGDQERAKGIKPYTPLVFELELVDIKK